MPVGWERIKDIIKTAGSRKETDLMKKAVHSTPHRATCVQEKNGVRLRGRQKWRDRDNSIEKFPRKPNCQHDLNRMRK